MKCTDDHDLQIYVDRQQNPMRCPWPKCNYVAATVAERNQHSRFECPNRQEEVNPFRDSAMAGFNSATEYRAGTRLGEALELLSDIVDDDDETPRQRAAARRAGWEFQRYVPPPSMSEWDVQCPECGKVVRGRQGNPGAACAGLVVHRRYKHGK
jgi:predicted RNA-binding Zn-ribbon protein involved in translation (DUF1610 family)